MIKNKFRIKKLKNAEFMNYCEISGSTKLKINP